MKSKLLRIVIFGLSLVFLSASAFAMGGANGSFQGSVTNVIMYNGMDPVPSTDLDRTQPPIQPGPTIQSPGPVPGCSGY